MKSYSIGGRRYADPDVISLIFTQDPPLDPRDAVLQKAREVMRLMHSFGSVPKDPVERLRLLASLCGISELLPLTPEQSAGEPRDAFIRCTLSGKLIVYFNTSRPRSRVVFSIAHEIAHTFIQNTSSGSRFRHSCDSGSREANEVERLCDLAASELVMPQVEFQAEAGRLGFELYSVPALMACFGSSYEATTFRLASAHPHRAAAGLLRFRLRLEEERRLNLPVQSSFFGEDVASEVPRAKYRRQSFHTSAAFPGDHLVRWNKSFDESSIVYRLTPELEILSGIEALPNGKRTAGTLQVTRAPYQRAEAHPDCCDLLFLWVGS